MLNKLIAFTVLGAACATAATAQTTAPSEQRVRRMILTQPFESSYLGVQTEDISRENLSKYGLSAVRGVGVDKVVKDSPAAKGGLQKGDVILKFEGEEVASVRKLSRLIAETAPEHTTNLIVLRDGGEREISVTLGKKEMPQLAGGFGLGNLQDFSGALPNLSRTIQPFPLPPVGDDSNVLIYRNGANRQIGIGVMPLTKQLGDYFGAAEGRGLLVNEVRENSPAAKAGLKAGDVIVEVEGKEVKGTTDLVRAVNEKKEGNVSLTFLRAKNRQTVSVTPETVKQDKLKSEEIETILGDAPDQNSDN